MLSLFSNGEGDSGRHNGRLPGNSPMVSTKFRWRKLAIGIALFLTFVFLFGPRESRRRLMDLAKSQRAYTYPSKMESEIA
jgi:hypothetical protein